MTEQMIKLLSEIEEVRTRPFGASREQRLAELREQLEGLELWHRKNKAA